MRTPIWSGRFTRDVKRAGKRRKDLEKLKTAIRLLAEGKALPAAYKDHPLKGDWNGWRDLHLEPDWLLIYRIDGERIELAATGTHADLFAE